MAYYTHYGLEEIFMKVFNGPCDTVNHSLIPIYVYLVRLSTCAENADVRHILQYRCDERQLSTYIYQPLGASPAPALWEGAVKSFMGNREKEWRNINILALVQL